MIKGKESNEDELLPFPFILLTFKISSVFSVSPW